MAAKNRVVQSGGTRSMLGAFRIDGLFDAIDFRFAAVSLLQQGH